MDHRVRECPWRTMSPGADGHVGGGSDHWKLTQRAAVEVELRVVFEVDRRYKAD
jgi:hypothetical protein